MNNCKNMDTYYKSRVVWILFQLQTFLSDVLSKRTENGVESTQHTLEFTMVFSRVISFLIENTREVHLINEDC